MAEFERKSGKWLKCMTLIVTSTCLALIGIAYVPIDYSLSYFYSTHGRSNRIRIKEIVTNDHSTNLNVTFATNKTNDTIIHTTTIYVNKTNIISIPLHTEPEANNTVAYFWYLETKQNGLISITHTKLRSNITISFKYNCQLFQNDSIYYNQNWKFIWFQHIRKSAGNSFCHLFYSNGLVPKYKLKSACATLKRDPSEKATIGVFKKKVSKYIETYNISKGVIGDEWGHFLTGSFLNNAINHLWDDVITMVVLRNPILRVYSDLWYKGEYRCHTNSAAQLIECVDWQKRYNWNMYTRVLGGIFTRHENFQNITPTLFNTVKKVIDLFDIVINLDEYEFDTHEVSEYGHIVRNSGTRTTALPHKYQLACWGFKKLSLPESNHLRTTLSEAKSNFPLAAEKKVKEHIRKHNAWDMKLFDYTSEAAYNKTKRCVRYLEAKQQMSLFR